MEIQKVTDASFGVYGKVLAGYDLTEMLEVMSHTPCPADDVVYVPGMDELEALPAAKELRERAYGGLPVRSDIATGITGSLTRWNITVPQRLISRRQIWSFCLEGSRI